MEEIKDILRNNKMSSRPEYYSGRGATTSDLNHEILTGIHRDIKKKFGDKQAKAFVKMVANIKVLSATTFIQELYELYSRDWKVKPKDRKQAPGVAVGKNANGEYDLASGMIGMFGLFGGGNDRDQTEEIRSGFLYSNGIKPKTDDDGFYTRLDSHGQPRYYKNT